MLHEGLFKLAAVVCLILQVWGGSGLDRASICVRPEPAPQSCGCCHKDAPAPESVLTSRDGCCIQATLPDDPTVPSPAQDLDPTLLRHVAVPASFVPSATDPVAIASNHWPPGTVDPPLALGVISTRLRL